MKFVVVVLALAAICDVATCKEASPCSADELIEISNAHTDCVKVHAIRLGLAAKKHLNVCNVIKELTGKCSPVFRNCFKTDDEYKELVDSQLEAVTGMLASFGLFKAGDLQCDFVKEKKFRKSEDATDKCSSDEVNTLKVRFEECGKNNIVKLMKQVFFRIRDERFDDVCAGLEVTVARCGDILSQCYSPEDVQDSKTLMSKLSIQMFKSFGFASC